MPNYPSNVSQSSSSQSNFDYFQMIESSVKRGNGLLVVEKPQRYILARDIKKYESEIKAKQQQEQLNSSLKQDKPGYLSADQKYDKLVNLNNSLKTPAGKKVQQLPKHVQGSEIVKKPSTILPFSNAQLDRSIVGSQKLTLSSKQPVLSGEDLLRDQNIFLEKNNPIDHTLYKEFNVGPRIDKDGKLVNHTLVGNPHWYNKQKDMQDKSLRHVRRISQMVKDSAGEDDDRSKGKKKSTYSNKQTLDSQSISSFRKISMNTEKSFFMRPDTTQSVIKQQQISKKKSVKKVQDQIEVTKDDLIKELESIEKRHNFYEQQELQIIKQMPLDQRNIFTRDERAIENYTKHLHDWDKQIKNVTYKSDRKPQTSCMLRGEDYRRKVEYSLAYDNLKTDEERFGKRIWYMYLRKYPQEKKKETDICYTEGNNEEVQNQRKCTTEYPSGQTREGNVLESVKNCQTDTAAKEEGISTKKTQSKVKVTEQINPNENIQSDIFSGFMTVTINDKDREIEVIRHIQDPNNFHLSSTSGMFQSFKKTSSQFFIENHVRECQSKLKGKMVVLNAPINDFLIVGKNKLQSERNAILNDKNKVFTKVVQQQLPEIQDNYKTIVKNGVSQAQNKENNTRLLATQQKQERTQCEIIDEDYNISQLSRTGLSFFPRFVEQIHTAQSFVK